MREWRLERDRVFHEVDLSTLEAPQPVPLSLRFGVGLWARLRDWLTRHPTCPHCGGPRARGEGCCAACLFQWLESCPRCGRASQSAALCPSCRISSWDLGAMRRCHALAHADHAPGSSPLECPLCEEIEAFTVSEPALS